jgi:aminoglycoside phosphotransferase (APT) family kinase protein
VSTAESSREIDFDPARLHAWLTSAMPDATGPMSIERMGGGQSNPTYFVTLGHRRMVLRKRPAGDTSKSAHDVGREFRIISALTPTSVPVPKPILYHADEALIGTAFYLMERIEGRIFHDASLPAIARSARQDYYRVFAQGLAAIHAVDWRAVGLGALARPGSFLERQIERWSRAWGDAATSDPRVASVTSWLRAHRPAHETLAIVHGDYKFTNLMFHPASAALNAVLDWELCAIGDPLADVAHVWSAMWDTTPEEYGGLRGLDLVASGLPDASEFFAAYAQAAPRSAPITLFHRVLAHFRNAGIFHGIGERAAQGNANATNAAEKGRLDRVYLARALYLIERAG